jgi:hypothetical protein
VVFMQDNKKNLVKLDVHSRKSSKKGLYGFVETFFRSFRNVGFFIMLAPIAVFYIGAMGISISPGLWLFDYVAHETAAMPNYIHYPAMGLSLSAAYFYVWIHPYFRGSCYQLLPAKTKTRKNDLVLSFRYPMVLS